MGSGSDEAREPGFGSSRLAEFVANHDCSVSRLMEAIKESRGQWSQRDDATALLLRTGI